MDLRALAVRILTVVALVFTALAAVGWFVFLGGFGYLTSKRPDLDPNSRSFLHPITVCDSIVGVTSPDRSVITGPCWDPYWVVSVLSPILFTVLIVKSILLLIKEELFRKFFIIHVLAVIAFVITMIVLCFLGYLLVQMRVFTQGIAYYADGNNQFLSFPGDPGYINALFAGVFLETMFLAAAWICHILAFLFEGMESKKGNTDTPTPYIAMPC